MQQEIEFNTITKGRPMTADIYTINSGATLYAGCAAPTGGGSGGDPGDTSWLPPSGQMARVSLNNVNAVADTTNPDSFLNDSDLGTMLNAWCSTVWCPGYGPLGSIVYTGGGHGDRMSNAVYRYDVASRLHSRITNGTPVPIRTQKDADFVAGNSPPGAISNWWGEFWTDATRTAVVEGKPVATHTYGSMVYVTGAAAGNTNGFVVIMGNFSQVAHHVDLDNPAAGWSRTCERFGIFDPNFTLIAYGCSVFDPLRNRIVSWPFHSGATNKCITLAFPSRAVGTMPDDYIDTYYALARYMVADDKYLIAKLGAPAGGPWAIKVVNPVTGVATQAIQSGTYPVGGVQTLEWDEGRRQLVGWDCLDASLWILQAPANPITGTWVWSKRTYTAQQAVLLQTGNNNLFNRLHYSDQLDAFFCAVRVDGAIQSWKA